MTERPIVTQLHAALADAGLVLAAILIGEAGWRAVRRSPPGRASATLEAATLIAVVVGAAGGLGMLVGGEGPGDPLHIIYGGLALASIPIGNGLSRHASPRRLAITTLLARIILIVLILRLFQTG